MAIFELICIELIPIPPIITSATLQPSDFSMTIISLLFLLNMLNELAKNLTDAESECIFA